jgi:hypothetical protein
MSNSSLPCLFALLKILGSSGFSNKFYTSILNVLVVASSYSNITQDLCNNRHDIDYVKTLLALIETLGEDMGILLRCLSLLAVASTNVMTNRRTISLEKTIPLSEKNVTEIINQILGNVNLWVDKGYPYVHFAIIIMANILLNSNKQQLFMSYGGMDFVITMINKGLTDSKYFSNKTKPADSLAINEQQLNIFKDQIRRYLFPSGENGSSLSLTADVDIAQASVYTCLKMIEVLVKEVSKEEQKNIKDSKSEFFCCILKVLSMAASKSDTHSLKLAKLSYDILKIVGCDFENSIELKKVMVSVKNAFPKVFTFF